MIEREERKNLRLSAELSVQGLRLAGTTRNLSSGGVCVEIDRPIKEGSLVRLTLFQVEEDVETEGSQGLELAGTVQWTAEGDKGHAVGIKFGNLSATQQNSLKRALAIVGEGQK